MIREIPFKNPLTVFSLFAHLDGAVFLDSAAARAQCGRYSFIALDPFLKLSSKNGCVTLGEKVLYADPLQVLADEIAKYPAEYVADLPPFQGGVAGFFGYELAQHLEKIPCAQIDDLQFPDLAVGFYDLVLAFDLELQRAWVFSSGYPLQDVTARAERALQRLEWLLLQIENAPDELNLPQAVCVASAITSNFSAREYERAVLRVIEYILAGDIFEANIAQRFRAELPPGYAPFDLYLRLRAFNPAPFAAFVHFADTVIASASPERFLRLAQRCVETRPIKGTRARSADQDIDAKNARELLASEKDHAENVMIVDLLRNDLSRVCCDHSVVVPVLCGLESYATVHHLVSVVRGKLRNDLTAVDLLRATFPGGSITGAPKIRAMEVIAEIEPILRGPYCGSIGYLGFNGEMDTSIVIRTFALRNNVVTFHAGGAVVLDSDAVEEYEETLVKARALVRALVEI